jgi:uncharacterized membrane protein SirB2
MRGRDRMDAFSYLSVLISIILGLAITQVLTGIGRLLQARRRVRLYWPGLVQTVLMLVGLVQIWWAMFSLRNETHWTFGRFLAVLLLPVDAFLVTSVMFSDVPPEGRIDLKEHYFENARAFFLLVALLPAASLFEEWVSSGRVPLDLDAAFRVLIFAANLAAAITRREWFHKLFAICITLIVLAYFSVLFTNLR